MDTNKKRTLTSSKEILNSLRQAPEKPSYFSSFYSSCLNALKKTPLQGLALTGLTGKAIASRCADLSSHTVFQHINPFYLIDYCYNHMNNQASIISSTAKHFNFTLFTDNISNINWQDPFQAICFNDRSGTKLLSGLQTFNLTAGGNSYTAENVANFLTTKSNCDYPSPGGNTEPTQNSTEILMYMAIGLGSLVALGYLSDKYAQYQENKKNNVGSTGEISILDDENRPKEDNSLLSNQPSILTTTLSNEAEADTDDAPEAVPLRPINSSTSNPESTEEHHSLCTLL